MARENSEVFTFPLPKRRYHGVLEFSALRVLSIIGTILFSGVFAKVFFPFIFVTIPCGLYLVAPTREGHGCDTLAAKLRNRRFQRKGGYFYSPLVRRREGVWESGLQPVYYRLPFSEKPFGVIRNYRTKAEYVY